MSPNHIVRTLRDLRILATARTLENTGVTCPQPVLYLFKKFGDNGA